MLMLFFYLLSLCSLTLCPPGPVDRAVPTQGLEGLLQGGHVDPVAPQHPQELSLSVDLTPRQLELAHLWKGKQKTDQGIQGSV